MNEAERVELQADGMGLCFGDADGELQDATPPLRVALVTTEARRAGAEKIVAALALGLNRHRFDPCVIVLKSLPREPSIAPELKAGGVPITSCRLDGMVSLGGGWRRLGRALDEARPDIVNSHLFHANALCAVWAAWQWHRGKRWTPVVATHHIVERRAVGWRYRVDRRLDRHVAIHVAVSNAVAEHQSRCAGIARERVRVIYNGVSIPEPAELPSRDDARRQWQIPPGVLALGSLGRLDPQKGFLEFVPRFAELARRFGALHWYIGGEGPLRKALTEAIAAHGLNGRVDLVGFVREPYWFYRAIDALAIPSRYEGLPLVAIEAMAAGCPLAASPVDGLKEIIDNGRTGLLFDPDNDAERLGEWLASDSQRNALATKARRDVAERFSIGRMIAQYEEVYEAAAASGNR